MYPEMSVIRDIRVLTEKFIPGRILHRNGQLQAIRDDLKPLLEEGVPRHAFIHGSPGTGKTCMSKYVSGELESFGSHISQSYNNCWENPSRFSILYNIAKDMGSSPIIHRKGIPTDEILGMIRRSLEEKRCVIILDEVDKIEDDRVLYDLLALQNVCLLMIANSATALYKVDPRIRSRLTAADSIEFPAYRPSEITDILKDRAEWGLMPGSISASQIEVISGSVRGDCRAAIEIMRIVAEEAEGKGLDKITDEMIRKALPKVEMFTRERSMGALNPHQRLILQIVNESGKIDSGELFSRLVALSEEKGLERIVDRTFRNYANRLVRYSFIKCSGSGRWRTFSATG
jgi:orc1/cdc6 family replication initiation protein